MRNNEIHHLSSTLFVMENQYTVSVKSLETLQFLMVSTKSLLLTKAAFI